MQKVPLLLFSGGMDSSYLLEYLLQSTDVETLYVKNDSNPEKTKEELAAREEIAKTILKRSKFKILQDHIVNIGERCQYQSGDWKFKQPHMWLFGALEISNARRHSELNIAYVSGDQIMPLLSSINTAWDALQAFSKQESIQLIFPLMLYTKQDIMERISPEVYSQIWICELPKWSSEERRHLPCRNCPACLTKDANLFIWKRRTGKTYASWLKQRHLDEKELQSGYIDENPPPTETDHDPVDNVKVTV